MTSILSPSVAGAFSDQQLTGHAASHVHSAPLVKRASLLVVRGCGTMHHLTCDRRSHQLGLRTFQAAPEHNSISKRKWTISHDTPWSVTDHGVSWLIVHFRLEILLITYLTCAVITWWKDAFTPFSVHRSWTQWRL